MKEFVRGRIAIIHSRDASDVRVGKICRSLSRIGLDVHYIGWDRRPDESKDIDLGGAKQAMFCLETTRGRPQFVGLARFYLFAIGQLWKLRPETICCVNEDNALPMALFKSILYRNLICDIFDPIVDRFSDRGRLFWPLLWLASYVTKLRADRLIATDARRFERLGAFRRKSEIIENYPEDPGAHLAKLPLQGPLKIYVTGTLCRRRGLEQLLHAARAASREVRIISSGWLFDDFATEVFVKDALVEYRGIITARESLEMAAECDALFCFYEPITVHHQFASPNKIYDAMSVGRPVLINSETIVSQWVADNNVGFLCEYEDRLELAAILDRLFALRAEQPANAARIRARFEQGFSWDCVEARLFDIYLQPKAGSSHREPCFEADQESKRAA